MDGEWVAAKRVLIYRLGSLGDMLVALPALHLVARAFPNAERRMLTNFPVNVKAPAAAAILGDSGLVQGYFRYAVGTRSPGGADEAVVAVATVAAGGAGVSGAARGVESARRDATFFRLCGIQRQIGVPLTRGHAAEPVAGGGAGVEPEAERLARNIAELGDAELESAASWDLRLDGGASDASGARRLIAWGGTSVR